MGINIGAGIIVLVASAGTNSDAKRAAWIYMLHNVISTVVFLIPLYLLIKKMGLINTYWGIASPYAASAFGVWAMFFLASTLGAASAVLGKKIGTIFKF